MNMKTDNHEVIFAIVNGGYAEDVMDVAKEHGARGGTIINARSVARKRRLHSSALPSTRRRNC